MECRYNWNNISFESLLNVLLNNVKFMWGKHWLSKIYTIFVGHLVTLNPSLTYMGISGRLVDCTVHEGTAWSFTARCLVFSILSTVQFRIWNRKGHLSATSLPEWAIKETSHPKLWKIFICINLKGLSYHFFFFVFIVFMHYAWYSDLGGRGVLIVMVGGGIWGSHQRNGQSH